MHRLVPVLVALLVAGIPAAERPITAPLPPKSKQAAPTDGQTGAIRQP